MINSQLCSPYKNKQEISDMAATKKKHIMQINLLLSIFKQQKMINCVASEKMLKSITAKKMVIYVYKFSIYVCQYNLNCSMSYNFRIIVAILYFKELLICGHEKNFKQTVMHFTTIPNFVINQIFFCSKEKVIK